METPEESITVQTPEQVGFRYALGGLGSRTVAFTIDTAIRGLLVLSIFVLVTTLSRWLPALSPTGLGALSRNWLLALAVLAYGVIDLGYFLLFEAFWSGQTPGKRLQKLRVIRVDGQPIGWLESAIRNILRAVDLLAGIYPLGLIFIFLSSRSQRIGDMAAGTVVIMERRRRVPTDRRRLRTSAGLEIQDIELHLSTLDREEYRLMRSFLERREAMDPENRYQVAKQLSERLMERWALPADREIIYESFIEEVVGAYERSKKAL
jgi:uncharacterized RDD family membrane protein YckC